MIYVYLNVYITINFIVNFMGYQLYEQKY